MVGQIDGKVAHPTNSLDNIATSIGTLSWIQANVKLTVPSMQGQAKKPVFSPKS